MANGNRGSSELSEKNKRLLWGMAAGRCEYEGCNEKLFYDEVTGCEFNSAYVAHIIAASPDGPRGDRVLSHQLSDDINNVMLMCDKHHRLIDKEDVINYPRERLLAMKLQHEQQIERLCNYCSTQKTEIVHFTAPIKGRLVEINFNDTVKAVLHAKQPASQYGIIINLDSAYKDSDSLYWSDLEKQLEYHFETKIKRLYDNIRNMSLSIFPIAPIPLIIKLGALLCDKNNTDVFQKFRVPNTWEWLSDELTNEFQIIKEVVKSDSNNIAIILALTADIIDERVLSCIDVKVIYKIKAAKHGVDCISSIKDLSLFWHAFQSVCDDALQYGRKSFMHIFPAIPVSAAFEVGRRWMPKPHLPMIIYDENEGFKKALSIGNQR